MKRILAVLFEIIVNVIISLVLLGILGKILTLSAYEGIVVGGLFFLITLAIWLRYDVGKIAEYSQEIAKDRADLIKTLRQINLFEGLNPELRNISDGIRLLSEKYGSDDLFIRWYLQKIEFIQKHLKYTLDTDAFDFDQSMTAERQRILSSLKKSKPDAFWAVASCRSIPHFADPDGTAFLRQVDKMLHDGEITEVRRLFLFDSETELNDVATKILLLLHSNDRYKYKIIPKKDFDIIFKNFGDKSLAKDFGVYGLSFVWETPETNVMTQMGFMCRNQVRIQLYRQLYEELWDAAKNHKIVQPDLEELVRGRSIDEFRSLLISNST